jgi:hypothetical protein
MLSFELEVSERPEVSGGTAHRALGLCFCRTSLQDCLPSASVSTSITSRLCSQSLERLYFCRIRTNYITVYTGTSG